MKTPCVKDQLQYVPPEFFPPPTDGMPSARRIRRISDGDFFKALRLTVPGLRPAAQCVRRRDYRGAFEEWRRYFAARPEQPPMAADGELREQLEKDAAKRRQAIDQAERLVRHEITGWTEITAKFGKKIKCNYNWGPGALYGFTYLSWITPLRSGYLATGDERYADCFDDLYNQWYDQRDSLGPAKFDPAVTSHPAWYELAVTCRARNLMPMYWSFRQSDHLRLITHARLMKSFLGFGRWLADYEARPEKRKGNWQISGCYGLLCLALTFPEFKEAESWRELAVRRLLEKAEVDFFADGGFSERISYAGGCINRLQELLDMGDCMGLTAAQQRWLRERLRRAYRFYLHVATPPHGVPSCGDAGYADAEGILMQGFKATRDRELLWPIRDCAATRGLRPKQPPFVSTIRRSSGFAIMRSGWEKDAHYMCINFGPYGSPHTHSDLLNFDLFAHGALLAADTCRFGSYGNPLDYTMRRAVSHNQVVVEDVQLDRLGSRGEDVIWSTQRRADFFFARHGGYKEQFKLTIERSVVFVRGEYWFISDAVRQPDGHYSYTWFLHSPWPWVLGRDFTARTRHTPGLLVLPAMAEEIRRVRRGTTYDARDTGVRKGTINAERHWFGYQKYSLPDDVVTYGTALIPYRRTVPVNTRVRRVEVSQGDGAAPRGRAEAFEVVAGPLRDLFVFAHRSNSVLTCGDVETDARMALLRFRRGKLASLSAVRISRLTVNGRTILNSRNRRAEFSAGKGLG